MREHVWPAPSARARAAHCVLGLAALLGGQASHAAGYNLEVTAGPAQGRTDCIAAQPCDHSGDFAGVGASARLDGGLEIGARYLHAGTFKGRDQTDDGTIYGGDFRADALGLTAGYGWQINADFRLIGRVGIAVVRTRFGYDAPYAGSAAKTTVQPLAGLELLYSLTPDLSLGIGYDETRFKVHETRGRLGMPGVLLRWNF